tara:strand:- start:31 stop:429 length:399 start_codon:yes stop_codon:yes gene_type:complete
MNDCLAVARRRLDGEFVSLAALHEASRITYPCIERGRGTGIAKPYMRMTVAARTQQIVRAAPQRDRDVAPTRSELGPVPAHPATLAKPDGCALHRCGLQGGADHLESPPMLFPGACYDDVQDDSREVAEAHF